jgi:peptidoglycan/LPS O-acetylase OafA/YrhL
MRLDQLTFTRFIAAISIVIFHYGKNVFPFHLDSIEFLFRQANIGVSYFFILSGFIMVIAYGHRGKINYIDFLKRRFARIYPVYFLAIIALFTYLYIFNRPIDYLGLFLNLTMIQSWFPGYALSFNGPGWSLAVELFFYMLFPLLFNHLYKKYDLKKTAPAVIIFFIISQVVLHLLLYSELYEGYPSKIHDFIFYFPVMHLNEFLIGNIAGLIFIKGVKKKNYDWSIIGLMVLFGMLLKFNPNVNLHNGMLAFVLVPLIILISSNNGVLTNFFSGKIFVFLGEISFGIYILQKPVYVWVSGMMSYLKIESSTLVFYISLVTLILCAAISYRYFETPIRKKINGIRLTKS